MFVGGKLFRKWYRNSKSDTSFVKADMFNQRLDDSLFSFVRIDLPLHILVSCKLNFHFFLNRFNELFLYLEVIKSGSN